MLLNCGAEEDSWVPWTAGSNKSILKEINPEYSLEGLMLKLKLQYFGHLTHWKRPLGWERLKAGGGNDRGWDCWMASLTRWSWVWASSRSWWWTRKPAVLQSMGLQRIWHNWVTELKTQRNLLWVSPINVALGMLSQNHKNHHPQLPECSWYFLFVMVFEGWAAFRKVMLSPSSGSRTWKALLKNMHKYTHTHTHKYAQTHSSAHEPLKVSPRTQVKKLCLKKIINK